MTYLALTSTHLASQALLAGSTALLDGIGFDGWLLHSEHSTSLESMYTRLEQLTAGISRAAAASPHNGQFSGLGYYAADTQARLAAGTMAHDEAAGVFQTLLGLNDLKAILAQDPILQQHRAAAHLKYGPDNWHFDLAHMNQAEVTTRLAIQSIRRLVDTSQLPPIINGGVGTYIALVGWLHYLGLPWNEFVARFASPALDRGMQTYLHQRNQVIELLKRDLADAKSLRRASYHLDRTRAETLLVDLLEFALHARGGTSPLLRWIDYLCRVHRISWQRLVQLHRATRQPHETELIQYIREAGAVPLDDYHHYAMYRGSHAFYVDTKATELLGPQGHFDTASSQAGFAEQVLELALEEWLRLGRPATFDFVEMGGGTGDFADNFLTALGKKARARLTYTRLWFALRYHLIEISSSLCEAQRTKLARFKTKVHHGSAINGALPHVKAGMFFSNELVDMFPPKHVGRDEQGRYFETYIMERAGVLQEQTKALSTSARQYLHRHQIVLEPGRSLYIQVDIDEWVKNVSRHLEAGSFLTLDYGYARNGLISLARHNVSHHYRGYSRPLKQRVSTLIDDFLLNALHGVEIGHALQDYQHSRTGVRWPKDMTVNVDFTAIEESAKRNGQFVKQATPAQKKLLARFHANKKTSNAYDFERGPIAGPSATSSHPVHALWLRR